MIKWMRLVLPPGSIVAAIVNEQRAASQDAGARMRFGAARKASGVVTGFYDATAVLPAGRVIWFEFKRPDGGIVSDAQSDVHARTRALGHTVIIATSIETCRFGLLAAGVALREAAGQLVAEPKFRVAKARTRLPADACPF